MKNNELVLQSYKYLYTKVRKYPRNTKKMRTMYDRAGGSQKFIYYKVGKNHKPQIAITAVWGLEIS